LAKKGFNKRLEDTKVPSFSLRGSFLNDGLPNAQDAQKTCKMGRFSRKRMDGLSGAKIISKNP
jgi:hypothetical protein